MVSSISEVVGLIKYYFKYLFRFVSGKYLKAKTKWNLFLIVTMDTNCCYETINTTFKVDILTKMLEVSPNLKQKIITNENDKITLNIGGSRFETRMSQFANIPGSRLHGLSVLQKADISYDKFKDEYYFDRNGALFPFILDLHR